MKKFRHREEFLNTVTDVIHKKLNLTHEMIHIMTSYHPKFYEITLYENNIIKIETLRNFANNTIKIAITYALDQISDLIIDTDTVTKWHNMGFTFSIDFVYNHLKLETINPINETDLDTITQKLTELIELGDNI